MQPLGPFRPHPFKPGLWLDVAGEAVEFVAGAPMTHREANALRRQATLASLLEATRLEAAAAEAVAGKGEPRTVTEVAQALGIIEKISGTEENSTGTGSGTVSADERRLFSHEARLAEITVEEERIRVAGLLKR